MNSISKKQMMEYNAIYDPLSTVEMRRRMIHSHNDPCCHDPQKSHFCGKGVIAKRGETAVHRSRTEWNGLRRGQAKKSAGWMPWH